MVNLDKQIASWRKRLLNDRAFYSDEVEELESHVRDAVDRLVAEGYTEQDAFLEATRLLGDPAMLRREYKNSRPLAERLFVPAAVVAVSVFLLPLLSATLSGWYWLQAVIDPTVHYTVLSPIGHTLLSGIHFLAVFVVIWAGALRMQRRSQRRFALQGSALLMGLMMAPLFLEYTALFVSGPQYMVALPAIVLLLAVFFKGPRLMKATNVLVGLAVLVAAHQLLAFGFHLSTMVMPLFDMLLGLIVGRTLAQRQMAERLRLA